jgi:type II secretory pathway component PulF
VPAGVITVGEQTAELSSMLLQITRTHQQELDADIDTLTRISHQEINNQKDTSCNNFFCEIFGLTTLLEPAMIVVIGLIIGAVIVAMYLPVFEMMNVIQ